MIRFSQFCCLLVVALALHVPTRSLAFLSTRTKSPSQTTTVKTPLYASSSSSSSSKSKSASVQEQQQQQQQQNNNNEVTRLRQEAARIRLEAEQLDASLTLRKIDTLQRKFQHAKKPEEKQEILAQLKQLKRKVKGKEDLEENDTMVQLPSQTMTAAAEEKVTHQKVPSPNKAAEQSKPGATLQPVKNKDESNESSDGVSLPTGFVRTEQPEGIATHAETNKQVESSESSSNTNISTSTFTNTTINTEHSPVAGFDPEDLELYVPICWEIEERLPNLTLREKMEVFRTEPRLQQHFSDKITALLLQPMQDMQQLEELRSQYLYSSSSVEKKELKRQIDALQTQMDLQLQQQEHQQQDADESGAVTYSDSLYHELPPINMTERLEAIRALPPTLQAVYKSRNKLEPKDEDDDDDNNSTLELAIMLDYWDYQLQLLEQIPYVHPITDNMRAQVTQAVQNLPLPVRRHVLVSQLQQQNVTSTVLEDVEGIVNQLCSEERKAAVDDEDLMGSGSPWAQFHQGGISVKVEAPEYNDIEFVDRSRFVKELYPSLARMEMVHPTPELVEDFMKECLDRKSFMVTSKPERVMGGYYIRGQNVISGDEEAGGIQLSTRIQERLQASEQLNEKLEFFYITDPSPVSDESFEMGYTSADPVIFLTTKEPSVLYEHAEPLTKFVVASCGVASIALFALATCELQPLLAERIEAALLAENPDVSFLTNIFLQSVFSMAAIQFSHEAAHRVVAWKDKFDVGLPTLIPSIQLGLQGAITPIKSPPPNLKSMFDFSIAGPTVGLLTSLGFLLTGLSVTASTDISQASSLPGLPVFMLQASALGGGLVEIFLGSGVLGQGVSPESALPLHPYAITGFLGVIANALALLPLGNTDGGRVALTMFGRRGTYIVKSFTALILCSVGIFGGDKANILLAYVLFALIWQRELETPARNEVEELDFARGALGIFVSVLVGLALFPLP